MVKKIETKDLVNPETTESAIRDAVVAGTETDAQRVARIEGEIRDKILREELERKIRHEASIAARKAAQMDKYVIKYDLADMKQRVGRILGSEDSIKFDKQADGSLGHGFHMYARGKVEWQSFAQPLDTIIRAARIFAQTKSGADAETVKVNSSLTGQAIAAPVYVVGQQQNQVKDIAEVDLNNI